MSESDVAARIAELEAQLAALRAQQTGGARQGIEANESTVTASPQTSAGRDVRDAAIGQGNLVLRDITIDPGGTLSIGAPYADLSPDPAELQQALVRYLRTFFERYKYLSLRGLGAGSQQVPIALDAVFVSVTTDRLIAPRERLFTSRDAPVPSVIGQRMVGDHLAAVLACKARDPDLEQWLNELLSINEREVLTRVASGQRKRDEMRQAERLVDKLTSQRSALEHIRHEDALVLLGDPGSGKTTVLRHLALAFAYAHITAGEPEARPLAAELAWGGSLPMPVLVQLRRFAASLSTPPHGAGALLDFLEQRLRDDRLGLLARHLEQRLEDGRVLLMLDGMDEIVEERQRIWAVEAVALFQSRFPRSRMVITSRTYAYRDRCALPPPFVVATLQPLTSRAQDEFIKRWYRAAMLTGSGISAAEQEHVASEKAQGLSLALERYPRLREIGSSPLLLTLIALIHQGRYHLPNQRARLYEECLLLLLELWEQRFDERAGLAATLGIADQTDRLPLIQPIAYQLQVAGREEASKAEVREWLTRRFLVIAQNDLARADALIDRFLSFLEGRSGLLIARDIKERYAFPHKTFQEYLAARELIYRGVGAACGEAVARRHVTNWREVILLLAGHLVSVGQPLEALALGRALLKADPPGTPAFFRSAVLAGEVLEELGDLLEEDGAALRQDVVRALVQLVEGGHLPAKERVDAALLLARLGDPRLFMPDQPSYWCAVEPGPFWHGDDQNEELRQILLPHAYGIGRFPVTNAEYLRFILAGGYNSDAPWWTEQGRGWLKAIWQDVPTRWEDATYQVPTQPVVGVTWYEAAAYCAWLTAQGHTQGWLAIDDELRLPTWLEWERAARGTDKRRYPWGVESPTPERANYADTQIGFPTPVGCFPKGAAACAALDMVGNVWEWTASRWEDPTALMPSKDFTSDGTPVISWSSNFDREEQLRCGARYWNSPFGRYNFRSFRLVRSRSTNP